MSINRRSPTPSDRPARPEWPIHHHICVVAIGALAIITTLTWIDDLDRQPHVVGVSTLSKIALAVVIILLAVARSDLRRRSRDDANQKVVADLVDDQRQLIGLHRDRVLPAVQNTNATLAALARTIDHMGRRLGQDAPETRSGIDNIVKGRDDAATLIAGAEAAIAVLRQRRIRHSGDDQEEINTQSRVPSATTVVGVGDRRTDDEIMEAELRGYLTAMYELEERRQDGEDPPPVA